MRQEDGGKIWGIPTIVAIAIATAVMGLGVWQGSTNATISGMGNTLAQHGVEIKNIEDGRVLNEQRLTRIETMTDAIGRTVDRIEKKLDEIPPAKGGR
jgi:hypothetical protein